jgi:selenide,water dikinase
VRELVRDGHVTGASARNWAGYNHEVTLASQDDDTARALLTDPQTSGGLLVACATDAVDAVLAVFARQHFQHAAVIGRITSGAAHVTVR